MHAWEVFHSAWQQRVASAPPAGRHRAINHYVPKAEAIGHAGAETMRHLRDVGGWSLLNSHLLAAQLVEAATEWLEQDGVDVNALRLQLRGVQVDESRIGEEESEWRRVTEAVLIGARARTEGSTTGA